MVPQLPPFVLLHGAQGGGDELLVVAVAVALIAGFAVLLRRGKGKGPSQPSAPQ